MENIDRAREYSNVTAIMFGRNVKELRIANGMTQTELAKAMSAAGMPMKQTTIAKMERGARPTTITEATALAALFLVSFHVLFAVDDSSDRLLQLAHAEAEVSRLLAKRTDAVEEIEAARLEVVKILDAIDEAEARRDKIALEIRSSGDFAELREMKVDLRTKEEMDAGQPWEAPYGEH